MNLIEAARMIWAESGARPDLARIAHDVYIKASRGSRVPRATLRWMVREAGLDGVFDVLARKHGTGLVMNMMLVLGTGD